MTNKDWALAYAAEGFAVLPIWWKEEVEPGKWLCQCGKESECERPSKHPIPKQGVKQATKDKTRIEAWWNEYPEANVAIATGEVSGLILIDIDIANGKAGDVSITTACGDHGGVPRTLTARSGSGGPHYWYRWRKNPFTRKIGFLKDVDYLSDSGYVIVQPSVNMHGPYLFDKDTGIASPEDIKSIRGQMAELPDWFDKLEGSGRAGKKGKKEKSDRGLRARVVNSAAMEFSCTDPRWVQETPRMLSHCDPDNRDDWVLFGIILGREFERNEDGWRIYNEWAARSSKYGDKGTQRLMHTYYYDDSVDAPQGGGAATIATILARAQEGGWVYPFGGLDNRPVTAYRAGRAIDSIIGPRGILNLLARERESEAEETLRIYAYGSGLGSVIEGHDFGATYTADGKPPNGWVLRVSPYTPMSIGSRITHTTTIVKFSAAGSPNQVECPGEISSLMLTDYSKHFPRLNGIVQWPMVVGKRVVGFEEPYDAKAGLYFSLPEGLDMSSVTGSKKEAQAALKWVYDVAFADFPFSTNRDQASALAMLLTFMQRRGMDSAPAFLVTAPIQGSGKTALIKFASRAVHGRTVAAASLSLVTEEQRKTITAALLSNPPSLLFDNLKAGSSFDSAELAIAMTSGEWEDRKLGSTERLTLPNRAVWCFTGNNITLKNDLRRRFVTIRMTPKNAAHYEEHKSRNIDTWPVEHRTEVLKALTSILLWASKEKIKLSTESGFPIWDAEVRGPIFALTGVDPFKTFQEQSEGEDEDEMEAAIGLVVNAWATVIGGKDASVKEFVDECAANKKSSDTAKRRYAEGLDTAVAILREKDEQRLTAVDYGYAIKMLQDRPFSMNNVDCVFRRKGLRNKVAIWELTNAEALAKTLEAEF